MTDMTKYPPGDFCWVELGTSDPAAAKTFYAALFGWKPEDVPPGGGGAYTLLKKDGKDVAGLYGLTAEQRKVGVPSHWLPYVSVASADATAKKAAALGGKVFKQPFDVMDVGRMAILQDPAGATFALWQAKGHIGAGKINEPGSFCWNELATTDTKAARTFYTTLFGWSANEMQMAQGGAYTIFKTGETQVAGMTQMTGDWKGIPPHWMVYFAVADCDGSAETARGLGAEILVPPTDIPTVGRFAVLQDPQRAVFSIIRLNG